MSTTITVAALKDEIRNGRRPQMIDVRTASEYASGHIPCTVNIPMDEFEARRKDLRLEDGVVLVCKAGGRAQMVADWLGANSGVRVLEGGTDAWICQGLEVVESAKTRWSLERQVRLGAGMMVLSGTVLQVLGVHGAIWLAMFAGAGLTFAGATDICVMGILLARMPWNQARTKPARTTEVQSCAADNLRAEKMIAAQSQR
jgi:rhodanese-related sulfurtransferase